MRVRERRRSRARHRRGHPLARARGRQGPRGCDSRARPPHQRTAGPLNRAIERRVLVPREEVLAREVPDAEGAGDVDVEGSDDAELGYLDADVDEVHEVVGDALLLAPEEEDRGRREGRVDERRGVAPFLNIILSLPVLPGRASWAGKSQRLLTCQPSKKQCSTKAFLRSVPPFSSLSLLRSVDGYGGAHGVRAQAAAIAVL